MYQTGMYYVEGTKNYSQDIQTQKYLDKSVMVPLGKCIMGPKLFEVAIKIERKVEFAISKVSNLTNIPYLLNQYLGKLTKLDISFPILSTEFVKQNYSRGEINPGGILIK